MRINLSPQQLAAFVHLARVGNFSEAARLQGVSQPALSRMLQAMEEIVGRRLVDRTTRMVVLTPTGRELLPIAERIVAEFEGAFGELRRFVDGQRGRITVAALPSIAAVLLAPAVMRYRTACPEVEIAVRDGLSSSVLDDVAQGRAEIGLTIRPSPRASLSYRPLVSDEFGLVCRPDDELAGDGSVPWSVFRNRAFVAMASDSSVRQITDAAFTQAGLDIPPLYDCAFLGTAGHFVAAGLGITALPRLTLPLMGQLGLIWRRLERPVMRRQIGVVTQVGRTLTPASQDFLKVLKQEALLVAR